jgi:hypothetical protein
MYGREYRSLDSARALIEAAARPALSYRILHAAARLVHGGRRRRLKIQATWPWAAAITAARQRIDALPQAL